MRMTGISSLTKDVETSKFSMNRQGKLIVDICCISFIFVSSKPNACACKIERSNPFVLPVESVHTLVWRSSPTAPFSVHSILLWACTTEVVASIIKLVSIYMVDIDSTRNAPTKGSFVYHAMDTLLSSFNSCVWCSVSPTRIGHPRVSCEVFVLSRNNNLITPCRCDDDLAVSINYWSIASPSNIRAISACKATELSAVSFVFINIETLSTLLAIYFVLHIVSMNGYM
ncbi:hypothetical protein ABIB48_002628 [Arthrobacter sp. UYCu511]